MLRVHRRSIAASAWLTAEAACCFTGYLTGRLIGRGFHVLNSLQARHRGRPFTPYGG